MKSIITSFLVLIGTLAFSQSGGYISLGYGFSYGKGDLTSIQKSYSTYKEYAKQTYSNDPFEDNGNWKETQASPTLNLTLGYEMDGLIMDLSYHRTSYSQEKELIRQSGYGRKFLWKEERNEILVNVGYKFNKIALFGGVGSNITQYTMASYQVYPDGTESINSEFVFNGLFKGQDGGLSYSAGIKYYFMPYLNAELRYIYSTDKFIGGPDEFLSITDNSFARSPGTSEYPEDYTQPISLNNRILVGVNRSYLLFTLCFELNTLNL